MKKKYLALLLAAIVMEILIIPGCSRVQAVPKSKMLGTYKLTRYDKSISDTNETVNLIETEGVESYLVVAENGNGYYVYKDNNTAPYILPADITFIPSDDHADKFEHVEYKTEKDSSSIRLGYDRDVLNKSLPYFKGNLFESTLRVDYVLHTEYKKVDKAQDLSYVNKQLPNAAEYHTGEFTYKGYFNKNYIGDYPLMLSDQADIYVYYFVKLDPLAHKANLYYMLKSDMIQKSEEVDYSVTLSENEFGGKVINLAIGNQVSTVNQQNTNKEFSLIYTFTVSEEKYGAKVYFTPNAEINDGNIAERIQEAVDIYQASLQNNN